MARNFRHKRTYIHAQAIYSVPPVIARWNTIDPLADMSQSTSPYGFCVNNPILFVDKFGLDTGKNVLNEVVIKSTRIVKQVLDMSLHFVGPVDVPRYLFRKSRGTKRANTFEEMAQNAIITYSDKTVLTGNLLDKLKRDPAFQAWRNQIIGLYKINPKFKHYFTVVKFGGKTFFSFEGDTELKLSVRNAGVTADVQESNGSITISYQMNDTFDLDQQAGRGSTYNGINGVLKPIWVFSLGGEPEMNVEANWNETIK